MSSQLVDFIYLSSEVDAVVAAFVVVAGVSAACAEGASTLAVVAAADEVDLNLKIISLKKKIYIILEK